jgi:hypothetical protein
MSLNSASVSVLDFFGGMRMLLIQCANYLQRIGLTTDRRATKGLVSRMDADFLKTQLEL